MEKTTSFYGFTANSTPTQKVKQEQQLKKLFRYKDTGVFRFADFAVMMIFEYGYKATAETITEGYINTTWGKQWGKLAKPRTEYALKSEIKDGTTLVYSINKTLFDYCNYISSTFNSIDEALSYAENEARELEKARAEAEAAEAEAERAKAEQEEREKTFKMWLRNERKNYIDTPIEEMCKEVFNHYYGENVYPACVDVVILAKDIENPLSREELISRLHNDNKASIKIFELFTGLALPKSYKERVPFLETVTPADYKETKAFKPRAKASAEQADKQPEKYYRLMKDKQYKEAYGTRIELEGYVFFAEKVDNNSYYSVTEATTGLALAGDKSLTSIAKCKDKIKSFSGKFGLKPAIDRAYSNGYKSPLYGNI